MDDTIIVTLKAGGFEADFELPWEAKLEDLYPRVLAALKKTSPRIFGDYPAFTFELKGAPLLKMDACLADYSILTGNILNVVRRESWDVF